MARARGSTAVLLDLYGCEMPLNDVLRSQSDIKDIILKAGMKVRVSDCWEDNGAYNLFFSLEESHLHVDVHVETWPEEGHIKVIVDLCNYSKDNAKAAKEIARKVALYFKPTDIFTLPIRRGPHGRPSWRIVYRKWSHKVIKVSGSEKREKSAG